MSVQETGGISRRRALAALGGAGSALAASGVAGCGRRRPARPERPNILVAIADDWSWPHAGVAGTPGIATPNFDRVGQEGALFTNAFVSAASCTPSRAALLTGRYHWELEQGANLWGTLPAKFPTYTDVLAEAGYHVGHCRKGWGPGNIKAGGREHNPAGPWNVNVRHFFATRRRKAPFCLWFGSNDPHRRYRLGSGIAAGLDPDKVAIPSWLPRSETVKIDLCDYYGEVQRFDRDLGRLLELLEDMGELDNTILVVTSDNGMPFPRSKATCYDSGTHVPLAIRWPKAIKAGTVIDSFVSLCDIAPTFYELLEIDMPDGVSGNSLLPLFGRNKDERVDRSFVVTGRERHTCSQEKTLDGYPMRAIRTNGYLYIKNYEPQRWPAGSPPGYSDVDRSPTKRYMLERRTTPNVKDLFRLAFGRRPAEELYDLRTDPDQLHNVADQPVYDNAQKRLSRKLTDMLKQTGDPRAFGEGEVFDRYAYYMIKAIHQ
ncbi:MAG: sulfatase-like hydrolase/transferase [Chitinivibrionales bacterium]|nr:sulfatase-like hydrolase/transferase [Chitinivibrionales bacterium]MBD3358654.1 sulfatase-like hydrolase/transferase [Chitinivibrionales bacterium]